jgi:hypothetical protein
MNNLKQPHMVRLTPIRVVIIAIAFCVSLFVSLGQETLSKSDANFPLTPGTYWIYRGVVRWFSSEKVAEAETAVKWKMEVEKCIQRDDVRAALVSGFPSDLDWSDGHPKRTNSLIIQSDGGKFYLISSDRVEKVWKTVQDPNGSLESVLVIDDVFLDLPLTRGKKFCGDPEQMERKDSEYCWVVGSVDQHSLNDVKGIASGSRTGYSIKYQSNPDDTEFTYVPGIGLVTYGYHHHGSIADTEIHLVEFHQGTNP